MSNLNTTNVLSTISTYVTANERPCPKTHLIGTFGNDVLDLLDSLKESGKITGKRGRNGGFVLNAGVTVEVTPVVVEDSPQVSDAAMDEDMSDSDAGDTDESDGTDDANFQRVTNMLAGNEPMDLDFLRSVDPSLADELTASA